jgi:Fatty acid cis/trans isomerase (CTI)
MQKTLPLRASEQVQVDWAERLIQALCVVVAALLSAPAAAQDSSKAEPDYRTQIKPLLAARCVTCHACFDAPCQLNLTSFEGIDRGASKAKVYQGARLREADPTRLGLDAQSTAEWRKKGFFSATSRADAKNGGGSAGGLMFDMLTLKKQGPESASGPLGKDLDLGTNRDQQCPTPEQFSRYARHFPQGGMPYGLPPVSDAEFNLLARWLTGGTPDSPPEPLNATYLKRIAEWETFLNGPSAKQRLMSRYLFEHLFLASFHFSDTDIPNEDRQFFRIVRSRTPPGQAVDVIATRMPFNDPGSSRFWYRIEPSYATVVSKTHMPYALSARRMARFAQLFLDVDYELKSLPGHDRKTASNPFVAYRDMPVESRYRFMLDDAEFFIRGFMKGPVCRGQVAVDVIEDRFWVVFQSPSSALTLRSSAFLARESASLRLPAESTTGPGPGGLVGWRKYKNAQMKFLMAKQAFLGESTAGMPVNLDSIWDGDGHNTNASLTIMRHFDNASVVRGLHGAPPKTAWIIDYSLFERIHYLLVAGFDVFGPLDHQLSTRLYMDFLRMDGEFNFLTLLPKAQRIKVRDYWYRDANEDVREYVYGSQIAFERDSDIAYTTGEPRVELMHKLREKLQRVLPDQHELSTEPDPEVKSALTALTATQGRAAAWMPEVSFLAVVDAPQSAVKPQAVYTLVHDTAHTNVAHLTKENKRLIPDEDVLVVARGFVAAYPNALFRVARAQLPQFVQSVAKLASEADYRSLVARFGISRKHPDFWSFSDGLAQAFTELAPIEAGVFDYNRLEDR